VPRRILVVCLRRLGDVLLATPLIRTLKHAYPEADIEALVLSGTEAALSGNADLARVHAWPARRGMGETWQFLRPLWRGYDLALALQASDRAHYSAWWASARRAAVTGDGHRFKRWLAQRPVPHDPQRFHTVVQHLLLADALGLVRVAEVVPPRAQRPVELPWGGTPYAVIHPSPLYAYKAWTPDGWRTLCRELLQDGLRLVLTGGPAASDRAYTEAILREVGGPPGAVLNLSGQLEFPQLTPLLEGAAVFIGPDTSVTHLAAACGTPCVALFGPSDPVTWGPWPRGHAGASPSPWLRNAAFQQINNVWLLQGTQGRYGGCIPCRQEGCERNRDSPADCLDTLSAARVVAAAREALHVRAAGKRVLGSGKGLPGVAVGAADSRDALGRFSGPLA
jgi:heptosyltransferase-3